MSADRPSWRRNDGIPTSLRVFFVCWSPALTFPELQATFLSHRATYRATATNFSGSLTDPPLPPSVRWFPTLPRNWSPAPKRSPPHLTVAFAEPFHARMFFAFSALESRSRPPLRRRVRRPSVLRRNDGVVTHVLRGFLLVPDVLYSLDSRLQRSHSRAPSWVGVSTVRSSVISLPSFSLAFLPLCVFFLRPLSPVLIFPELQANIPLTLGHLRRHSYQHQRQLHRSSLPRLLSVYHLSFASKAPSLALVSNPLAWLVSRLRHQTKSAALNRSFSPGHFLFPRSPLSGRVRRPTVPPMQRWSRYLCSQRLPPRSWRVLLVWPTPPPFPLSRTPKWACLLSVRLQSPFCRFTFLFIGISTSPCSFASSVVARPHLSRTSSRIPLTSHWATYSATVT